MRERCQICDGMAVCFPERTEATEQRGAKGQEDEGWGKSCCIVSAKRREDPVTLDRISSWHRRKRLTQGLGEQPRESEPPQDQRRYEWLGVLSSVGPWP